MPRTIKKSRRSNGKTRKQNGGLANYLDETDYELIFNMGDGAVGKAERAKILQKNYMFFTGIMALVVAKNKLDFPPLGPVMEESQKKQDFKLRCIFKAISELQETAMGYDKDDKREQLPQTTGMNDYYYPLGGHGAIGQTAMVARNVTTRPVGSYKRFDDDLDNILLEGILDKNEKKGEKQGWYNSYRK